jgi:hypothetical protein
MVASQYLCHTLPIRLYVEFMRGDHGTSGEQKV